LRRWVIGGETIENARVMVVTRYRQRGPDIIRYACLYIVTAKIEGNGEQVGHLAQFLGPGTQLWQRRFYLLFIVRRLRHVCTDDEYSLRIKTGLGVETTTVTDPETLILKNKNILDSMRIPVKLISDSGFS
jgi:hypothetical protein